jgi:CCR4-NOT transcription complex subunit 9
VNRPNRACSVLALFQCVAAHPETRNPFLKAQISIFLYPFLNTLNKSKPYEYIRLTTLGVIGALVKIDNREVIQYLINIEIIPLCL